jgi:hypothetical protein
MAEAAQRMLMREFKDLSKEAWTHIEVRLPEQRGEKTFLECSPSHAEHPANRPPADQRKRLRVECSTHSTERRLALLRRLLQGQDDIPPQLSA